MSAQAAALRIAVIGGGPAGLMAAEVARAAGANVDLYEQMGSVGRKFLVAGKGGLNLTHSESFAPFVARYGKRSSEVAPWLAAFDAGALRAWARALGVETFVGSSGRVFPTDLKAAPLLRGWVRRLRASGVRFHCHQRWLGWDSGALTFAAPTGVHAVHADAVVLALGGGSWPVLGSDGRWFDVLERCGVELAPLQPSNCGFDVSWSAHFSQRHAGQPVKSVVVEWRDGDGALLRRQGEFVVTAGGLEGSLIYALSARLRDEISVKGKATLTFDLVPGRDLARLTRDLSAPRGSRSFSDHLRRHAGVDGVKAGLLREALDVSQWNDASRVAATLKALPLELLRTRPIDEAISTAGGVLFHALDAALMLKRLPGVFVAGEMIDWEAPTGGYLLAASLASGRRAGEGAVRWALASQQSA